MSDATLVVLAVTAGVGVGLLTQFSRRRATWSWRIAASLTALVGVLSLFIATGGTYLLPMVLFVVMVAASYAFDRRLPKPAQ